MFRILFIFLILGLSLYGLFSAFSPLRNTEQANSEKLDFDSYLAQALERNTSKTWTVVFDVSEFGGERASETNTTSSNANSSSSSASHTSGSTAITDSSLANNTNSSTQSFGMQVKIKTEQLTSSKGYFGTPPLPSSNTPSSTDCHGIIFDPCIVIERPTNSISDDMYLGTTRIYGNVNEMG